MIVGISKLAVRSVSLCWSGVFGRNFGRFAVMSLAAADVSGGDDGCEKTDVSSWPAFQKMLTPELKQLASFFVKYNYELRIAGGAVRDLMEGKPVNDIDFATTATPENMKAMFEKEQVRMIKEQGIKHGTVTPRVVLDPVNDADQGENFEVTTLRIDGPTLDGRRPKDVQFTTDWKLDAERRDLTVNSMFLGLDGTVYDFFKGKRDLEARTVAFVGDADKRIKEDYLRIMRYFRFYGRIAAEPDLHQKETLEAIGANAEGLKKISGERIWAEWKKILVGNFADSITRTMVELGLGPHMGLPDAADLDELFALLKRSKALGFELMPATVMAALLSSEEEVLNVHNRLKMSCLERDTAKFVVSKRNDVGSPDMKQLKCWWVDAKSLSSTDVQKMIEEFIKYRGEVDLLKEWRSQEFPKMPVGGRDLKEAGCPPGPTVGYVLDVLKEQWKSSDFKMTKEELMSQVPDTLEEAIEHKRAMKKRKKSN